MTDKDLTSKKALDALEAFQRETAQHFDRQAHWSNAHNAENCRKSADAIQALRRELDESRIVTRERLVKTYERWIFGFSKSRKGLDFPAFERAVSDLGLTITESADSEGRAEALQELARLGQEWEAEGRECECPRTLVMDNKPVFACRISKQRGQAYGVFARCIIKGGEDD